MYNTHGGIEGGEYKDCRRGEGEPGREDDYKADFQKSDIATIISDWERRAGGGEEMDSLALPVEREKRINRLSSRCQVLLAYAVRKLQLRKGGGP